MTICVFNHQLLAKQAHLTFSTSIHRRHAAGPEDLGRGSNQCGAGVAECDGTSDANRLIGEVVQSRRRGPSSIGNPGLLLFGGDRIY